MKKPYLILLSALFFFSACSKKHAVSPDVPNTVNISGTVYPTTTIGSQVWTTVNYNGPGGYNVAQSNIYGNFYTLIQAQKISLPAGWRVPTIADYNKLLSNYTSTKDVDGYYRVSGTGGAGALVSASLIDGTNTSGFNALYGGFCNIMSGQANYSPVTQAYFLTADSYDETSFQIYGVMITSDSAFITGYTDTNSLALSIRFVKDK